MSDTTVATNGATAQDAVGEVAAAAEPAASAAPVIEILGDATDEQIAALVAVFSALGGGESEPEPRRSLWSNPRTQVRRSLAHGRGAWRASALPRW